MTYLSLNIHALKAANLATGNGEDGRIALTGVSVTVDAENITYVASNGHMLFAFREPANHTSTNPLLGHWIIPSTAIAKMKCPKLHMRKSQRSYARCTLTFGENADCRTQFGNDVHEFKYLDVTYPDWRRVVPLETDPSKPIHAYNPDYLASLKKAGVIMGQGGYGNFSISYNGEDPALISYSDVENAFAVIVPYRQDPAPAQCPNWVHPQRKAA